MKKYIIISVLLLQAFLVKSQTVDTLLTYKGALHLDTTRTLPRLANYYFNGFGDFVSLTDSVRAQFSGTANRITITSGVIDIGTDVVTLTGTQTLTNKTLTQPIINSTSSSDTTTYKPLAVSSGGVTRAMTYWPGSGGGGAATVKQVHASGATVTASNTTTWLLVKPALAALTITLPATPTDAQNLLITFKLAIDALTVSPNSGQTISGAGALGEIAAGEAITYQYDSTDLIWYRTK